MTNDSLRLLLSTVLRLLVVLVIALGAGTALAACGGDDNGGDDSEQAENGDDEDGGDEENGDGEDGDGGDEEDGDGEDGDTGDGEDGDTGGGEDGDTGGGGGGDDEEGVRDAVNGLAAAEGIAACDFFSETFLRNLGGRNKCEQQFRNGVATTYDIRSVDISGSNATVVAKTKSGKTLTLELVEEGGEWKINSFNSR